MAELLKRKNYSTFPKYIGCILFFLLPLFSPLITNAQDHSLQGQARSLINLLDYISQDYSNAVKDGKVLNEAEYQEQKDFTEATINLLDSIGSKTEVANEQKLSKHLEALHQSVLDKKPLNDISEKAQWAKKQVVALDLVDISPKLYPDAEKGKKLYATNCQSCHGESGAGDGPAGLHLDPPPANLLDADLMRKVSAMQVFNTVRLGVSGTAMQAFDSLSDKEIWDVSFYVKSLRFQKENSLSKDSLESIFKSIQDSVSLSDIATLSDEDLKAALPKKNPSEILAAIRLYHPENSGNASLRLASTYLDQSLAFYKEGKVHQARDKALFGYLDGVEPVEKQLLAIDSKIVNELETNMNRVRASIKNGKSIEEVSKNITVAKASIKKAGDLLGEQAYTFWFSFLIAASILLREGLEAVLIIITILGLLRSLKARKAINWVHGGWIVALGLGIASWFFTDWLLSFGAQNQEVLEAVGSLVAVVILIYVGFWLHNKTDAKKWQEFIKTKVSGIMNHKKLFGLAFISFIVVFREAFESILFLSSLELQVDEGSQHGVYLGAISAIIAVIIIAFILLRFSVRVPIKKMFQYSATIIMIFSVILAGQGIHAFQEAGYVDVTSLPINFHAGVLGIYPTVETYVAQIFIILVIVIMARVRKRQMQKAV